jgi:EmrB/QacA subfamily drug resistance transporter
MALTDRTVTVERGLGSGRWWALAAIVVSGLVIALDNTILFTALPTLAAELHASTSELQWISAAYTLTLGGLLLAAGVLGDRYGRRRLLLIGLALFGVASVAASQMTSATGLIAMRAIMGAGGAIILPLSLSIIPSLFSEEERPRAVGLASVGAFLGLPLGPLVAGWLLTRFAWGSIFLINAPVVVVALLGVAFLVPESRDPSAGRLDLVGAVLSAAAVVGLVYGIIEQPQGGWTGASTLVGIVGGLVALVAFVAWTARARHPFVDLGLFRSRRFSWATVAFIGAGFAMSGLLFVLTPYIQIVEGNDAFGTGLRLLPLIGAVIVGGLTADRLSARLGGNVVVGAGLVITGAGALVLSRAEAATGFGLIAAGLMVIGLGLGLAMPTAVDAILGALPDSQTGAGTALTRALQMVAGSFGVAVLGSILNSAYQANLGPAVTALPAPARSTVEANVAGAAAVAAHLPGALAGSLVRAAHSAYASGMSEVTVVCAVLMVVFGVLVGAFMPAHGGATRDG